MNHLFRFAWLLLTVPFRPRTPMLEVAETHMRVWPTDLDMLMHMNNGVYLSLMDLGRIDLMARSGSWGKIRKAGIYPVVVSEAIRFRKSLLPFQKFFIRTQIVGWDERYFFLRQKFVVRRREGGEDIYASAIIKGRFLGPKGIKVSTEELLKVAGVETRKPKHDKIEVLITELDAELRE